jgi:hypothetical protein
MSRCERVRNVSTGIGAGKVAEGAGSGVLVRTMEQEEKPATDRSKAKLKK